MFEKNLIAIEIGYRDIKILEGSKKNIKTFGTIKTPKGAYENDSLADIPALTAVIADFLKKEKIKAKDVSFVIRGQDIVMRQLETPAMDRKGIWTALQWEVSQYLPEGGKDYYFDFEIIEKINNASAKAFKIMVVSVPKIKIEKYMELTEALRLKISAIDIAPNNTARVFSNINKLYKSVESIGIIDIGGHNTTFTVVNKNKLSISREFNIGLNDAAKAMYKDSLNTPLDLTEAFVRDFNFSNVNQSEQYRSINSIFISMMISIDKVVQFYTTGQTKKSLDVIYVIGQGSEISGVDQYIKNYFNTTTEIPQTLKAISVDIKHPNNFRFRNYVNTIGLLLRKD